MLLLVLLARPYLIEKQGGMTPVAMNADIPRFLAEQELIIVDLLAKPVEKQQLQQATPGVSYIWFPCERGLIDPRVGAMAFYREGLDRIFAHGGVFIIFATRNYECKTFLGTHSNIQKASPYSYDTLSNFGLLSDLSNGLSYKQDSGQEIYPSTSNQSLNSFLVRHIKGGSFSCTLEPYPHYEERWVELATNKYGKAVSGLLVSDNQIEPNTGFVFFISTS